jgi:hypothetical protein
VRVQVCRENRKSWGVPAGSQRRVNSYTSLAGRQPAIRLPAFTGKHRVGRVLSFFCSRQNWDCPNPSPAHARWRERGWESPNSDDRTYTVVLFIYTYFVVVQHSTLYSNKIHKIQTEAHHMVLISTPPSNVNLLRCTQSKLYPQCHILYTLSPQHHWLKIW